MASVLYISYTGLLDPLGQSQVLQYMLELAKAHSITLLTFEKPDALADTKRLTELQTRCKEAGIDWHHLPWQKGAIATFTDLAKGKRVATQLARNAKADVVHCRSYLAGLMGLAVKRRTGARYIFDMRGFWPDERVDGGIWKRGGWQYRLFKRAERRLFLGADHVVSLTRAGVAEFLRFDYLSQRPPQVSVIPTCTNLNLFHPVEAQRDGFTLGYVGSVGSWYVFSEVARTVARLFALRDDARFLVINKGGHDVIRKDLLAAGVDMDRVEIREVPYDQVSSQIARMDAGVFFIKPAWSKRASCPTRMGEFLACGKPCLANGGVGDVRSDFAETGTGVPLDLTNDKLPGDQQIDDALLDLFELAQKSDIAKKCRAAAQERFSLSGGVEKYDAIYRSLAQGTS